MPPWEFVVVAPLLAALGAGLVESIPVDLDDNLSVPIAAAAILWGTSLVTRNAWHESAPTLARMVPLAVAFNGMLDELEEARDEAARQVLRAPGAPIRTVIVGIVDSVYIES